MLLRSFAWSRDLMRALFVLLLLLPGALSAQAGGGDGGRIAFEQFTLPNGLRVIYSEDHSTPIVSVDVWYAVGSRNERSGRSGFAHLFEHMMFQGSAHVKKAEHGQLVERAGGTNNGSTAEDRTEYFETVPSNRLNLALWLEADRMRSLAITEENFENQRQAVKEERRLRIDNQPYQGAFSDGVTWPFDSTSCFPYAHTVIGSMADLDSAKLADVQAFFDAYYAANNATIVVVGDFNPSELRRLVNEYFAGVPSHPQPDLTVRCNAPAAPGTRRREVHDAQANLEAVLRFYRIPEHRSPDTPALEGLNIILRQGESSPLNVAGVRGGKAAGAAAHMTPENVTLIVVGGGGGRERGGGKGGRLGFWAVGRWERGFCSPSPRPPAYPLRPPPPPSLRRRSRGGPRTSRRSGKSHCP